MIATALAHGGATVLIASRKGEDCQTVAAEINAEGPAGKVIGFGGDAVLVRACLGWRWGRRSRRWLRLQVLYQPF